MTDVTTSEAAGKTEGTAVTVSRQVPHSVKSVWQVLMTDSGAEALLGQGARLGDKGHKWSAEDGTCGVTRSFHPLEQIRFSWHETEDSPATIVDLHLSDEGDQTNLEIVHDHLPGGIDRDKLTQHWADALQRIDQDAL